MRMEGKVKTEYDLYKDIQGRTKGEIYIGVVGPVRTGKSTFIKRFMDLCVLPLIKDAVVRERMIDELPQSAQGKTIMTTEPKFIPQEAVTLDGMEQGKIRVRLIDCVGYMVEGASGHLEGEVERKVKTPWSEEEIPFTEAARIGTDKVIQDHATIGVVVTTDGSIGDIPRESYVEAEAKTIAQLRELGKPFVILLNCEKPHSVDTAQLKEDMEEKYQAFVLPVNCKQMRKEDVSTLLAQMVLEFPVTETAFYIPKWTEMLPCNHKIKAQLLALARTITQELDHMRDVDSLREALPELLKADDGKENYVQNISILGVNLENGKVSIGMDVDEKYYYEHISEMAGVAVHGEYEMIAMLRELTQMKQVYERVEGALTSVEQTGYGVLLPELRDIKMEDPVVTQQGSKFGVRIKAVSPSIHMIRANIETEISPIVGTKEQAEDLITYIQNGEKQEEGVWTTNIFGKSIGELVENGIREKIIKMDDECQEKLQDTMQKIVNDSNGGLVCLII